MIAYQMGWKYLSDCQKLVFGQVVRYLHKDS